MVVKGATDDQVHPSENYTVSVHVFFFITVPRYGPFLSLAVQNLFSNTLRSDPRCARKNPKKEQEVADFNLDYVWAWCVLVNLVYAEANSAPSHCMNEDRLIINWVPMNPYIIIITLKSFSHKNMFGNVYGILTILCDAGQCELLWPLEASALFAQPEVCDIFIS